jgi:hypothetical protein
MDDSHTPLVLEARALLVAAEQLEHAAGSRASVAEVAGILACVEPALRALDRVYEEAARSIIPSGDGHESASARLARAAAEWPRQRGGAVPSHEQLVRVLSSLHDAAAALRFAAAGTSHAREVIERTPRVASQMRSAA